MDKGTQRRRPNKREKKPRFFAAVGFGEAGVSTLFLGFLGAVAARSFAAGFLGGVVARVPAFAVVGVAFFATGFFVACFLGAALAAGFLAAGFFVAGFLAGAFFLAAGCFFSAINGVSSVSPVPCVVYITMETYPDTYSKLALSMTAAQHAKENLVEELGVGEDLPFNFFGWCEDELLLIIQCSKADMKIPAAPRLEKCEHAIEAMRKFWNCDAITLVAEGFQSKTPEMLKGIDIFQAFVEKSSEIEEVLTATHVEMDDFNIPMATLVSVPYQYLLGRHVVCGDAIGFERGVGDVLTNAKIPATIARCISEHPDPDVMGQDLDRVMGILTENGFNVQEFI